MHQQDQPMLVAEKKNAIKQKKKKFNKQPNQWTWIYISHLIRASKVDAVVTPLAFQRQSRHWSFLLVYTVCSGRFFSSHLIVLSNWKSSWARPETCTRKNWIKCILLSIPCDKHVRYNFVPIKFIITSLDSTPPWCFLYTGATGNEDKNVLYQTRFMEQDRGRNCAFLVANVTKNRVLAAIISQEVARTQLAMPRLTMMWTVIKIIYRDICQLTSGLISVDIFEPN